MFLRNNRSFVESARKSLKAGKKIRADMISLPQNDLRHTGHIGILFLHSAHLNQKVNSMVIVQK